jgi:hypothetical protein
VFLPDASSREVFGSLPSEKGLKIGLTDFSVGCGFVAIKVVCNLKRASPCCYVTQFDVNILFGDSAGKKEEEQDPIYYQHVKRR